MPQLSPAKTASLVDELVIGVHHAVFAAYRDQIAELLAPLELTKPGLLLDLAEFYLAGPTSPDVVVSRFRYEPHDEIDAAINNWIQAGAMSATGEIGPALRRVFDLLLHARADVAQASWQDHELIQLALRGARQVLDHADGELTRTFQPLPLPSSLAHRLHHVLTGLRYVRMDLHVLAWQAHGLTAAQMVTLANGPRRDQIEVETNERYACALEPISDSAGWYQAMLDLQASTT